MANNYESAVLQYITRKMVKDGAMRLFWGGVVLALTSLLLYGIGWFFMARAGMTAVAINKYMWWWIVIPHAISFSTYSVAGHFAMRDMDDSGNPFHGGEIGILIIFMWVLYCSPMLIFGGFLTLFGACRLHGRYAESCGRVLMTLYCEGGKVSYDAFNEPELLPVVRRLTVIDGILRLKKDPAGLAMNAQLQREITAFISERATAADQS